MPNQYLDILQSQVCDPPLKVAIAITVRTMSYFGLMTAMAPPANQDFHNSRPLQTLAVLASIE